MKQLCFILQKRKIYMEKILVTFNEIPIFFVCCDDYDNKYLALCYDTDVPEYIIVKKEVHSLLKMLTQHQTMYDAMLECNDFWKVKTAKDLEHDIVTLLQKKEMDKSVLPISGAYYEPITKDDKDYINLISLEHLMSVEYKPINSYNIELNKNRFNSMILSNKFFAFDGKKLKKINEVSSIATRKINCIGNVDLSEKSCKKNIYKLQYSNKLSYC